MLLDTMNYLGPGTVLEVDGCEVTLRVSDRVVRARLAFAGFYRPAIGDSLLTIGTDESYYAIGVLDGAGGAELNLSGDVRIRSLRGSVEITAAREVNVTAPDVRLRAVRLSTLARTLRERLGSVRRWVRGSLEIRAGRVRGIVRGDYDLKAERIVERAEGDVAIDGTQIRLG